MDPHPAPPPGRTRRRLAVTLGAAILLVALGAGTRRLAKARTYQLFGTIVPRVDTRERAVALTFDDGPTDAVIDTLVRVLGARGVRATFFVIGGDVAGSPAAARALVAAGHELGNHSWSHPHLVLVTPGRVRREVERTDSAIRAAGFRGEIRFRPPYGYKLVALPWFLARTGRTTVTWDVEPDSYADVAATPERIVAHVLRRVRPGSIILLHPWYPSRATSLAAVPALIDSLHARGYRVGTVGALLRGRRPVVGGAPGDAMR
jgi:peptidoglycan-N-acetylglucosamine deacetylase